MRLGVWGKPLPHPICRLFGSRGTTLLQQGRKDHYHRLHLALRVTTKRDCVLGGRLIFVFISGVWRFVASFRLHYPLSLLRATNAAPVVSILMSSGQLTCDASV